MRTTAGHSTTQTPNGLKRYTNAGLRGSNPQYRQTNNQTISVMSNAVLIAAISGASFFAICFILSYVQSNIQSK